MWDKYLTKYRDIHLLTQTYLVSSLVMEIINNPLHYEQLYPNHYLEQQIYRKVNVKENTVTSGQKNLVFKPLNLLYDINYQAGIQPDTCYFSQYV